MTVPTTQETALLRSRPHNSKLFLSIYQPTVVFSGIVSGSVSKGSQIIPVYNISGTYGSIGYGMTAYVGTSFRGSDKGKIRARWGQSIAGVTSVQVAENSHINWQNGDYITVVNFYEIWPVYPRIIQDPGDETNTLWYKDYDFAYTNQNSVLGYFINMGCHHAGFLDNGQCRVYYTAQGTQHVRSDETGTSYYWEFEGGTPSSYVGITPGYVSYTNVGHFSTRLFVSGSVTGAGDGSYRHVSVYDMFSSGTANPIKQWELKNPPVGSRDQGGYTASIRVFESIPETMLRDGSLIVIFSDDRYGTTDQSVGGNATNRSEIFFVGYVVDGTIKYNYKDSYVDFDIASPTEIMKMAEGFSVSVQDSDDPAGDAASNPDIPSGWVALLDMDIKKAIFHYLRWHSTVLTTCDFQYVGNNYPIQYFDADRTSIYDAVNTLISSAVVGGIVSDRQGKIWAETDIYVTTGTYNTGLALTKQDWMNEPFIEDRPIGQVSYIEIGGIAYNGTTFEALMAAAPGVTPAYRGKIQRIQGLALANQTQLNALAGNLYSQLNARYPNIEMQLAGNYRNYDIAPQEIIPLTISPSDTIRGITFNRKSFYINSMRWEYNPRTEVMFPVIGLEEIASGFAADTLEIPDVPPTEGDAGGFTIPPIVFPPINLPPFPTFNVSNVILAQPTFSYNESTAQQSLTNSVDGYRLYYWSNTELNRAVCSMAVPLGVSSVSLSAVFRTLSGTGNIHLDMESRIAGCAGAPVAGAGAGSAYYAIPIDGTYFWCLGNMSHVAPAGNIIIVRVHRDATDPNDTFTGHLDFIGVLATFA